MDEVPQHSRKRLRAAHACDSCRIRKIRCDGQQPCAGCSALEQECTHGAETNSRGKSDLILEGVLRVEAFLHDMSAVLAASTQAQNRPVPVHSEVTFSPTQEQRTPTSGHTAGEPLQNAVLDSLHTSTTESILQWPHFDVFPSLRRIYVSIFILEQSRSSLPLRPSIMVPYVHSIDIDRIISSFEHTVNFWYPTVSQTKLKAARVIINTGQIDDSSSSCLALAIMALGCASQAISGLVSGVTLGEEELEYRASRKNMGDMYMDALLKKMHIVHMEMSPVAVQTLFLVALYFAFLRRPLQAWEGISTAATKCRLLLSYAPLYETEEDKECMRRIFWSCYILESDYLAELSALPQNGLANIESSIPLPGQYATHASTPLQEESALYFLACISMRRLLNRVHNMLYAAASPVTPSAPQFPYLISELAHQLEEWRSFLPFAFRFTVDTADTSEHGGFLRQRYLTCRSVIYRPYLSWVLNGAERERELDAEVEENCRACLDACLLHILNLRAFSHTVLVDTWICSLSMTGAMLVLLAASRVPSLRRLVGKNVLAAGPHLKTLLEGWIKVSGEPMGPSVEQSLRIMAEVSGFVDDEYRGDEEYRL